MTSTWFITGTDTGCGKTTLTVALARFLADHGRVACFKPVASGSEPGDDGRLYNDDALQLQKAASVELPYAVVNPITLAPAIAPHIAAQQAGVAIEPAQLAADLMAVPADWRLVEGAGGWMVPLSDKAMTKDLAQAVGGQVVLVIGLRLGAINHGLLSARAIESDGCQLVGWIANIMDADMPVLAENISTLSRYLGPPLAHYRNGQIEQAGGLERLIGNR